MTFEIIIEGNPHRLSVERQGNQWFCELDGQPVLVDAVYSRPNVISLLMDGKAYEVKRELTPTDQHIWVQGVRYSAELRDPRSLRSRRAAADTSEGPRKIKAPMPGKVVRLLVHENETVEQDQGLLVVEAMKMQNELKSPRKGVVRKIFAVDGANVNAGDVLAIVE